MSTLEEPKRSSRAKPAKAAKTRKSKPAEPALDRPFDPAVLRRAEEIAAQYRVVLEPEPDLGFVGRGIELPYSFGDGPTADECVGHTREGFVAVVATMLEMGELPPPPASADERSEQVSVRLTIEEKTRIEEAARTKGFRGVSDYMRNAALSHVG